jgi:hypothetical protein
MPNGKKRTNAQRKARHLKKKQKYIKGKFGNLFKHTKLKKGTPFQKNNEIMIAAIKQAIYMYKVKHKLKNYSDKQILRFMAQEKDKTYFKLLTYDQKGG